MQHFSKHFVQILVIRSKCRGGGGGGGGGAKMAQGGGKISGGQLPPYFPRLLFSSRKKLITLQCFFKTLISANKLCLSETSVNKFFRFLQSANLKNS